MWCVPVSCDDDEEDVVGDPGICAATLEGEVLVGAAPLNEEDSLEGEEELKETGDSCAEDDVFTVAALPRGCICRLVQLRTTPRHRDRSCVADKRGNRGVANEDDVEAAAATTVLLVVASSVLPCPSTPGALSVGIATVAPRENCGTAGVEWEEDVEDSWLWPDLCPAYFLGDS